MDPYLVAFRILDALPLFALILAMLSLVSFLIWCAGAGVLWMVAHRNREDAPQPMAENEWFESLPAAPVE
jgi:hypothetical protein